MIKGIFIVFGSEYTSTLSSDFRFFASLAGVGALLLELARLDLEAGLEVSPFCEPSGSGRFFALGRWGVV